MPLESQDAQAIQDLAILRATHARALLVGPSPAVDAAIAMLRGDLRQPVIAWTPADTPDPPVVTRGTLIVRDVGSLAPEQQQRLLDWVDHGHGGVQVISTSGGPMWPLVERGAFLSPLYYRLGVLCVDLTAAASV